MKKKKIRKRLEKAVKTRQPCRITMEYKEEPFRYIPLKMSDKLLLSAQDSDFQFDGYSIRRMEDIEKVKLEDDFVANITIKEMNVEGMESPDIDISDWETAFTALQKSGKITIVEKENADREDCIFAIGIIEKVGQKGVFLRYFGPDGIWDKKQWKIPYDEITSVTVGSRYAETYARYLPEMPEPEKEPEK